MPDHVGFVGGVERHLPTLQRVDLPRREIEQREPEEI